MNGEAILAVKNLSIIRGKREILKVSDLSVAKGTFLAVTGPNGAGKSTLLKTLAFLEPVDKGDIFFYGRQVTGSSELLRARRRMATVFQDPLLLRGTVIENVALGLKLRGTPKTLRLEKARHWLTKLGIAQLAKQDVRTLSGGEAQRVSLARAMAMEPDVLFLDEPFTYLDAPTKALLVSELKTILAETATTALMVTHDLSDLPYLADRMLVLMDGQVAQTGTVRQVLACPESRQVAEFLGMENILPGILADSGGNAVFTAAESSRGLKLDMVGVMQTGGPKPGFACVRPEYVIFHGYDRPAQIAENALSNLLRGRITALQPYGYFYKIKIRADFELTALAASVQVPDTIKPGDEIWLSLPPEKIHFIEADN